MYFVHPQIERKKILKALFSIFKKPNLKRIEEKLSFYFPEKRIYFLDMARTGFRMVIEKLGLKNTQILMPAFICEIFYPILKDYNIRPVFIDVEIKSFNLKPEEIEKKISEKTRAILVTHTFGLPFDFSKLKNFPHQLPIIEDCAQAFGAKREGKFVGNFGLVSIFSLYKQFPIARGGILVCPKDWNFDLKKTNFNFRDFISFLNSISFFAFLFKKFGREIAPRFLRKEKEKGFLAINSSSLSLFSFFFEDFEKRLEKRKILANFFQEKLKELGFEVQEKENNVFCYLSALVPKNFERDRIVRELEKRKIFCTRIWHTPIILNKKARSFWKINPNEFPNTIEIARRIINFPLQDYYSQEDIEKMVLTLKNVLNFLK